MLKPGKILRFYIGICVDNMASESKNDIDCKVVLLGAGGVGKSALTIRFVTGKFAEDYDPTIEDSYRKQTTIDDISCKMEILDTAGQEEFGSMQDQWIRQGNGFLLVYSVISSGTFEKIATFRNKILRIHESKEEDEIPIVIAGNKCDLESQRQVQTNEAKAKCDEWKCGFFETSAKNKVNNEECFYDIVRRYRRIQNKAIPVPPKKKKICTIL